MPEDRTSFDFRHERLQLMGFRTQEPLVKSKDDANVDDWIKGVRALKEKRRIEDEARNRQLEEDILKERRARQERRALRGRSVSPSKSPADSTSSKAHDLEPTASIEAGSTMQLTATGRDDSRSVTERRRALVSSLLLNGLPSSKPEVQMTIQDSTHQTRRPSVQAETKLLLASAESRTAGNMDVPPQKPRPNSERILEVNTSNIYDTTPVSDDAGTFSSLRQGLRSTNTVRSRISDPVKENLLTAKSSLRLTALPGKSVSQPEQRTQISLDARSNQAPDITKSKLSSLPESHVRLDDAISKLREGVISETSRSTPATTVHFSSTLAGILLKNRPEAKAVNRSFDSSRIQPAGPSNDKLRHLTKDRARRPRGRNQIVSATSEDLQPSQESTLFTQVVAMPQEAKRSSNSQMNIPDQRWREEMLRGAWSDTEASTLKDEKRHSLSPPTTSRGDITENVRQSASQPAVIVKSKTSCSVPTASPFSNLPVRPKTTSKSMSSLTSIADLIRGRADSISKVQKSRDVNMERPSVVQVWKLLETTLERVEFRSIWNLFYEDVTLLMEVAMQNSKTCWYKWIGISSRIENKGEANALCGPGNIPVAVRQGKEPASFCDFLQGVICTRSPAVLESASALYSVRKFHTGFAVDQIPCNAEALCSGFVFVLVSADWPTKIWIGSGSLPAELDVARSAAIELSKHPKVIEMSEGSEDLAFWEQTAGPAKYAASSYWRLRREFPWYKSELWTVNKDQTVHKQPDFAFPDLVNDKVHIIDCFFEVYVHISHHSQKSDIMAAVQWLKQFILSVSPRRPFPPMCLVLCPKSKFPRDLRAVFRTPVRDGPDLKILELDSAEIMLRRSRFRYSELKSGTAIGCDLTRLDLLIDPQDFTVTLNVDQQTFERSSAFEQNRLRRDAMIKLLEN